MRKADLIDELSGVSGQHPKVVWSVLQALVDETANALARDGAALFPGIGKMVVVERAARKGRNPKTGEPIEIPAKRVVVLRADRKLNELINAQQWRALNNGER